MSITEGLAKYACQCGKVKEGEKLPISWFRFRFSVEFSEANRVFVSGGTGDHRAACSLDCLHKYIHADLEHLEESRVAQIKKAERIEAEEKAAREAEGLLGG